MNKLNTAADLAALDFTAIELLKKTDPDSPRYGELQNIRAGIKMATMYLEFEGEKTAAEMKPRLEYLKQNPQSAGKHDENLATWSEEDRKKYYPNY